MQTLTRDIVSEQIGKFIAPLSRRLEELTRLLQRMTTTWHLSHYPGTEFGIISGTATQQTDMVSRVHRTWHRWQMRTSPDTADDTRYSGDDRSFHPPTPTEMTDPYDHLLDAVTTLPSWIHTNNPRLLETQLPTCRGTKDNLNEFENLLRNYLHPASIQLTEVAELRYFQSLLREEAIEFYESLTITTETRLNDVLTKFRRESLKEDLKEVARFKSDQANYDLRQKLSRTSKSAWKLSPNKRFKVKQDNTSTFLLGKLSISIQQDLTTSNIEDATPKEIKTFLHRRHQYNRFTNTAMPQPFHQATTMQNDGKQKTTQKRNVPDNREELQKAAFIVTVSVGHRQAECCPKARGAKNGILPTSERETNADDHPQYNRKLVFQICGYTGHSAKYCNQRQRNTSPINRYHMRNKHKTKHETRDTRQNG